MECLYFGAQVGGWLLAACCWLFWVLGVATVAVFNSSWARGQFMDMRGAAANSDDPVVFVVGLFLSGLMSSFLFSSLLLPLSLDVCFPSWGTNFSICVFVPGLVLLVLFKVNVVWEALLSLRGLLEGPS